MVAVKPNVLPAVTSAGGALVKVMFKSGVTTPTLPVLSSANQTLPSGPVVIPRGPAFDVGVASSVIVPFDGFRIPIWLVPGLVVPQANYSYEWRD